MALPAAAAGASWLATNASWLIPSILSALGLGASALGVGKGKKLEFEPQISPQEQELRSKLMSFLGGRMGQPATPYPGALFDPMTMMGMNIMSSVYGKTPYQGSQFGTFPQQTPFQQPMGGGMGSAKPPLQMASMNPQMMQQMWPLIQMMMGRR